jgi:hypothetical protein
MTRSLLACAALLVPLAGCSPKFLIADHFIPDTAKVVRTKIQFQGNMGGDSGANVVSYIMQVCDLNDGRATNCKTTTVLDNVVTVDFYNKGGF